MTKLTNFLMLLGVLVLLVVGCQNQPAPVQFQADDASGRDMAGKFTLADEATLVSAEFHIYVVRATEYTVDVHRITASWEETTVNWTNFAGSFAPEVEGSFIADAVDWRSVDITVMVQAWLDGTYENHGFLLDQAEESYPRTMYFSKDAQMNKPFLKICYTMDDDTLCDSILPIADTYIWEFSPDFNDGLSGMLYTGWETETDLEKQSLIKFDISAPEEPAAIGDYVWHDMNMNGIQDEGEMGIAGVTVHILDCADSTMLGEAVTDENGHYMFDGLAPGEYYLHFVLPSGHEFSPADQGTDDAADSDADPVTGATMCTMLEAGEIDSTWDAGLYEPVGEGCTYSKGYWKNHAGFGPQDDVVSVHLPIWLGNDGGDKSLPVTDSAIAVDVLAQKTYGFPSNGVTKLYAQLLAAKLNIANGADDGDVADAIEDADDFLADYDWNDWDMLSRDDKKMVLGWKDMLDMYNNGQIGPGHCDEYDDHDDYNDTGSMK